MRFDFDDEQAEIKETARQFLAARFTPAVVRELAEGNRYDGWRTSPPGRGAAPSAIPT